VDTSPRQIYVLLPFAEFFQPFPLFLPVRERLDTALGGISQRPEPPEKYPLDPR
jgi:hypothetical protein